jgi:hypothetical protein
MGTMVLKLILVKAYTMHGCSSDPGIPNQEQPLGEPTLVHLATLSEGKDVDIRRIIYKIEQVFATEW